jgi:hypothetical protein
MALSVGITNSSATCSAIERRVGKELARLTGIASSAGQSRRADAQGDAPHSLMPGHLITHNFALLGNVHGGTFMTVADESPAAGKPHA